jgi:ubiquinone/menaquinone biosynthesis C-methylase UbiE
MDQMVKNRLDKEQSFHDERFGGDDGARKAVGKYYLINRHADDKYLQIASKYCYNKKLLEYGCGSGNASEQWMKQGAQLTGIDISPEGIKKAKQKNSNSEYKAEYFVMNAEKTDFENNSFDIIVGTGIIHHLDLINSYQELRRVLKDDGHAVFIEPLGHNPFINLYRALTPQMRTEDEHPLKMKDIKLLKKYFSYVQVEYFSLFTFFAVPFRNMAMFNSIYTFFKYIDKIVLNIPFLKRYAWTVVIHASSPKD